MFINPIINEALNAWEQTVMNWQWIEDFVIAAVVDAEVRRRGITMTEEQAMRFVWAAVRPAGKA